MVFQAYVPFQSIRPTRDVPTLSKNLRKSEKSRKIISGVKKKWVWRVTDELIEMVQYIDDEWTQWKQLQVSKSESAIRSFKFKLLFPMFDH